MLAPPKKGAQPPIFGPCLLCPNAWMDQDATYHGGRPRPRRPCVRWGPSSLLKGGTAPPLFGPCLLWPNSWMDHHQAATRYGGRPHCVRWGPSSPKGGGTAPPIFGPCLLLPNSWMDQDATGYGGKTRPRRHCVRCGPSSPQRGTAAHVTCIVSRRSPISATAELLLRSLRQTVLVLYNGPPLPPRNCRFSWRFGPRSNTLFFGPS